MIELPATDDQSDVPPLPNLAQLPPPQLTWRPKHLANPMAGGALPPAQRLRAPPPPDRERNLPLRI
ncbi:MAG: hypothetical protein JNK49_04825 [Planctomycetes bacterium]|nr:hypothetical protein [Planctomycetota bacterium]